MNGAREHKPGFFSRWWRVIGVIGVVLVAFLVGFVPQYHRAGLLESDLVSLRQERQDLLQKERLLQVRGAINHVFVQVTRNNYGLASQEASEFFTAVRKLADSSQTSPVKESLRSIMERRDAVIAGLAKANPEVRAQIEGIVDELNQNVPVAYTP